MCKMGRNIDEPVVDGFLNVFGNKNLKVADLSIAPILPEGNTALAAQMIGLNVVRFIREDAIEQTGSSERSYLLHGRYFRAG
jgi:choline dehydrogenase